ncbi:MAG: NMD3-related protein [Thermoplasmatota archaeon]
MNRCDVMFCVECGQKEIFKDGVCINCYVNNKTFTKGPELIDIIQCSNCSAYKYKNTWLEESLDEVIKRHLKDAFTIDYQLQQIEIRLMYDEVKKNIDCVVEISGVIDGIKIVEKHHVLVRIKRVVCDVCSKQSGGYYEAVLQVRAENRTPSKGELEIINDFVLELVAGFQKKGNRALFIADASKERGGIDYYLSEKGSAFSIAKKIQERYGGILKQSSTNIGMKDSRQIYRMTYLIRLPAYRSGDFIEYNNSIFYISSISSSKVHVIDLKTWSEQIIDAKNLQKVRVLGGPEYKKEMIVISQTSDEIQVMDPHSYKILDITKPKNMLFDKKYVSIVVLEDALFLFPEKNTIDK